MARTKRRIYVIQEPNGEYNFSSVRSMNKVLSSDGQGFANKVDCLAVMKNQLKPGYEAVDITREEFNKLFEE